MYPQQVCSFGQRAISLSSTMGRVKSCTRVGINPCTTTGPTSWWSWWIHSNALSLAKPKQQDKVEDTDPHYFSKISLNFMPLNFPVFIKVTSSSLFWLIISLSCCRWRCPWLIIFSKIHPEPFFFFFWKLISLLTWNKQGIYAKEF